VKRVFGIIIVLGLSVQGLLAASPDSASSSPPAKQPWEWSDAERLAGRFDPAFIKAIRHPRWDLPPGVVADDTRESDWWAGLDGNTNPELLMPFELFTSLLDGLNSHPHLREARRPVFDARLIALGYKDPEAFWNELEPVVHDHLDLTRRIHDLGVDLDHGTGSEREAILKQLNAMNTCQSRTTALAAARAHFGRETFDRLLYTVIPPGTGWSLDMSADGAFHLALLATGCQSDAAKQLVADSAAAAPARPAPYWDRRASPATKRPWEWTDEERMAFRLDPNVVEVQPPAVKGGWRSQKLEGNTHPEAIFPFELFSILLSSESGVNPHPDHEHENARLFAMGIKDPDAWRRELAPVLSPYTAPDREIHEFAARLQRSDRADREAMDKQLADLRRAQCRSTAQGLTAAREHYGRETFDRLLYMLVAPGLQLVKGVGNDLEKELRYQARGCGSSTSSTLQ
jgi:hypothetical protein